MRSPLANLNMTPKGMSSRLAVFMYGTLGMLIFYVATAGLVPTVGRHAQDGCLQWLKPTAMVFKILRAYELPASVLGRYPIIGELLEVSAEFWFSATDAPETT